MQNITLIEQTVRPCVEALGYDLIQVALSKAKRPVLQVMIDRLDMNHVTVDDCAKVSRGVSTFLDENHVIEKAYVLEVTSPGLDRPLVKPQDFMRFQDQEMKITLVQHVDGRKQLQGMVQRVDQDGLCFQTNDGKDYQFRWEDIARAKLIPVFDEMLFFSADDKAENTSLSGDAMNAHQFKESKVQSDVNKGKKSHD